MTFDVDASVLSDRRSSAVFSQATLNPVCRTCVPSPATLVCPLPSAFLPFGQRSVSAPLRQSPCARDGPPSDPRRPFKFGPMDGRYESKSGRRRNVNPCTNSSCGVAFFNTVRGEVEELPVAEAPSGGKPATAQCDIGGNPRAIGEPGASRPS